MSKLIHGLLLGIGLIALGFLLYMVKLKHDLDASLRDDLNHRFTVASAQVTVLDGGAETTSKLTEHQRVLVGQAVVTESLLGFRVVSYFTAHSALPSSIEEVDLRNPGQQVPQGDPWGNSFRLSAEPQGHFLIVSGGLSGNPLLTEEERTTLRKQPLGRAYQLHGKIVFKGGLLEASDQNEGKR